MLDVTWKQHLAWTPHFPKPRPLTSLRDQVGASHSLSHYVGQLAVTMQRKDNDPLCITWLYCHWSVTVVFMTVFGAFMRHFVFAEAFVSVSGSQL